MKQLSGAKTTLEAKIKTDLEKSIKDIKDLNDAKNTEITKLKQDHARQLSDKD